MTVKLFSSRFFFVVLPEKNVLHKDILPENAVSFFCTTRFMMVYIVVFASFPAEWEGKKKNLFCTFKWVFYLGVFQHSLPSCSWLEFKDHPSIE